MKRKYIVTTVILALMVIILSVANICFSPVPQDKALRRTPKEAETKYPPPQEANRGSELPQLGILWEKNLFAKGRGTLDKQEDGPVRNNDLELVGICKFGEICGAIIINKNAAQANTPSLRISVPQNPQQPGKPQQPSAANPMQSAGKAEKRFYQIGQRLPNGFTLKEIKEESILLARGKEEIVLKMQVGSKEGAKRVAKFKPVENPPSAAADVKQSPSAKAPPSQDDARKSENRPGAKENLEKGKKTPSNAPPPPPIMNQSQSIKEV